MLIGIRSLAVAGLTAMAIPASKAGIAFEAMMGAGIMIAAYEYGLHTLRSKVRRWPNDVQNGERLLDILDSYDAREAIRELEFGSAPDWLLDRFSSIRRSDPRHVEFADCDLRNSHRYLLSVLVDLHELILSEMFADLPGHLQLPIDWKGDNPPNGLLYRRYRNAQKCLRAKGLIYLEALDAFRTCLAGASRRA